MPTTRSSTPEFELLCFNLRTEFKNLDDGPNGWTHRREACASLIAARQPPLVCVQEATPSMLNCLVSHLDEENYGWLGTSRSLKKGDEMAAFLYNKQRVNVVAHQSMWLAPDGTPRGVPAWDAMYPRTLETAVFRLYDSDAGRDHKPSEMGLLRVLNTHFDHVGVNARRCAAELIAKTIAQGALEWPQCVQIVTGDFNNVKHNNEVYHVLTNPKTGLLDAARQVPFATDMVQFTIHKFQGLAFEASRGDGTVELDVSATDKDAQHIDWVLFRNGVDMQVLPVKYQVITDRVPNGPYLSDHFPVSVKFSVLQSTSAKDDVWHESQVGSGMPSDGPTRSRL